MQRHGQGQIALLGGILGQDGLLELVAPLRFEVKLLIFIIAVLTLMMTGRGEEASTPFLGQTPHLHRPPQPDDR